MYRRSEITKRQYSTGEVAEFLGVKSQAVILQDRQGKLPFKRTPSNRRTMFKEDLIEILKNKGLLIDDEAAKKRDVIYCRVSSHEQKAKGDIERQVVAVMEYASDKTLQNPLIMSEVGSGLNDNRKKLNKLLSMLLNDEVNRLFISNKDRLTQFGYHYFETICVELGVEIHVAAGNAKSKSAQEEMIDDMMALLENFTGKLYGMRGKAKKEILALIESIYKLDENM
jgi:predicted site-specific integrase-resolvase